MNWSALLREELGACARRYASSAGVPTYTSRGGTVLFKSFENGHGSFVPSSYREICANRIWQARLHKAHTQRSTFPEEHRDDSRELDSSNSSDALLMNLFCFPGFAESPNVSALLGSVPGTLPEFGVPGQVPLGAEGAVDATEIDMRLGNVIVESKLTEVDFTSRPKAVLAGYRDFDSVFQVEHLPQTGDNYESYQLLRNILCATAYGYGFTLLCDGRRPDLIRAWWNTAHCVRDVELRSRLRLVLWQELAAEAPKPLGEFLRLKYGL